MSRHLPTNPLFFATIRIPARRLNQLRCLALVASMLCLSLVFEGAARADDETFRPEAESFLLHCSGCHRADGRGVPGVAPDLRQIGRLLDLDGGREYLASVPGVAQAPIGDRELARLLNWVLIEIAGRAPDPLYGAAEIHDLRAEPLRDPLAARKALFAPKP